MISITLEKNQARPCQLLSYHWRAYFKLKTGSYLNKKQVYENKF